MKPFERQALKSPMGQKLRSILASAASREPAPRSVIRAALADAGIEPDGKLASQVIEACTKAARDAADGSRSAMLQHQLLDIAAVELYRKVYQADHLLGSDKLPGEAEYLARDAADAIAERAFTGARSGGQQDFDREAAREAARRRA